MVNRFGRFISPADGVLDAGAGVGLLTERLLKLASNVLACDISFKSLKENPAAKRRLSFLANIERLPLVDGSVDWVASNFALHWCDWKRAIGEFKRVSRKGFFFSVPVEGSLKGLGFPFPSAGEVVKFVSPSEYFVEEIEIPFRGRDFILFFKRTGTGFNPNKKLSAFEILKNPSLVEFYGFRVLFVLKRFNR